MVHQQPQLWHFWLICGRSIPPGTPGHHTHPRVCSTSFQRSPCGFPFPFHWESFGCTAFAAGL